MEAEGGGMERVQVYSRDMYYLGICDRPLHQIRGGKSFAGGKTSRGNAAHLLEPSAARSTRVAPGTS